MVAWWNETQAWESMQYAYQLSRIYLTLAWFQYGEIWLVTMNYCNMHFVFIPSIVLCIMLDNIQLHLQFCPADNWNVLTIHSFLCHPDAPWWNCLQILWCQLSNTAWVQAFGRQSEGFGKRTAVLSEKCRARETPSRRTSFSQPRAWTKQGWQQIQNPKVRTRSSFLFFNLNTLIIVVQSKNVEKYQFRSLPRADCQLELTAEYMQVC